MRFPAFGAIVIVAATPWVPCAAATFTVDRTDHAPQASACTDAPLDCSLTGAIALANISTGPDTVVLTADSFRLENTGEGPVVRSEILVSGVDMDQTLVEAAITYRSAVFEVLAGGSLTLEDLTISGATNITGGALVVSGEANANAELKRVTVTSSRGNSMGGGITVRPPGGSNEPEFRLRLIDSVVSDNLAEGQDAGLPCAGAGMALHNGPVHIENSEIVNNTADVLARGGGLCIGSDVEVTLIDSWVSRNDSRAAGGGIYSSSGILRLEGTTVHLNGLNSAPRLGAGIYALGGEVDIIGATFRFNGHTNPLTASAIHAEDLRRFSLQDSTSSSLSSSGVGIEIFNVPEVELANIEISGLRTGVTLIDVSEATIEGLTIDRSQSDFSALTVIDSQNVVVRSLTVVGTGGGAAEKGAALVAELADIHLENCLFVDNQVADNFAPNAGQGGAIWARESHLELTGCGLFGNVAEDAGGAIYVSDSDLVITHSSIYRNTAGNSGGGIRQFGGSLTASNSTISGNHSDGTTALFIGGGHAELQHVTFSGPEASIGSQPGSIIELIGSTATFANTAITGGFCSLFFSGSVPASMGGNVVADSSCLVLNSGDLLTDDLRIQPLALIGSDQVIHLPAADSPLIDAATNCLPVDQRDVPRAEPCDTGSVERSVEDNFLFLDGFEASGR